MGRLSPYFTTWAFRNGVRNTWRVTMTIPPVTRFLTLGSLTLFLSVYFGLVDETKLWYIKSAVKDRHEAWRIPTSFMFGSRGLNYVMDVALLYRYSDIIESGPYYRHSPSYAWQLMFASLALIIVNSPLQCWNHHRPLMVCVTYLCGRLSPPESQVTWLGFWTFPFTFLGYVLIFLDLIIRGKVGAAQSIGGAVVGHLWWWLMWRPGTHKDGSYRDCGPWAEWGNAPKWLGWFIAERGNGDLSEEEMEENEKEKKRTLAEMRESQRRSGIEGPSMSSLGSHYRPPPLGSGGCCGRQPGF
jgi:Derlin-2/3